MRRGRFVAKCSKIRHGLKVPKKLPNVSKSSPLQGRFLAQYVVLYGVCLWYNLATFIVAIRGGYAHVSSVKPADNWKAATPAL